MSLPEFKQLNEVISLYKLEKNLKDIYVEGTLDRDIIIWFLSKHGRSDIKVYPIAIVDIQQEKFQYYSLPFPSNRSKLIVLSYELTEASLKGSKVICIADRDYEDFLPCTVSNPFLLFTDYNSIESYLIDEMVIEKFISIALGSLPDQTTVILPQVIDILKNLFFIRLVNEKLQWGMEDIKLRRYLNIARDSITFEESRFIDSYLMKNKLIRNKEQYLSQLIELKEKAPEDERLLINGHDFIDIFHILANKTLSSSRRKFEDKKFFGGAFLGCLEAHDLKKYPLFQNILSL